MGEIADIAYISPDRSPVHLSCSKAGIVDITADNRLIGRAVGDTQVTVNQSGKTLGTVAVTVAKCEFQGIFFDPGSLAVEVDGTMRPKVFAMVAGSDPPRNAEIAPEWIAAEKTPSPEFAGFDAKAFELSGVKPTIHSSPQELAVRMGNLKAAAPVEVVMAPCRLELTPAGPIDLPLGQMMRLQGFANYSGGRRVQVPSERLKWFSQEKSVPGLELYRQSRGRRRRGGAQGRRRAAERLCQLSRPGIEPRDLQERRGRSQRQARHRRRSHAPHRRRAGPGRAHGQRSQRRRGTGALAHRRSRVPTTRC